MVAQIRTISLEGIAVQPVMVQVQIASGYPGVKIVGMAEKSVNEATERVRSAIHSMGLALPAKRITVNLAPADRVKEGAHFDLPIALAILAAQEIIPQTELDRVVAIGELGLDGSLAPVSGVLPTACYCLQHEWNIALPLKQAQEARWAGKDLNILASDDLLTLVQFFRGQSQLPHISHFKANIFADEAGAENDQKDEISMDANEIAANDTSNVIAKDNAASQSQSRSDIKFHASIGEAKKLVDIAEIRGQENAKRSLEICAAGRHNLLMIGPPGIGKSMLAQALPGILPRLSAQEALEISMIYSVAGELPQEGLVLTRPYRQPHHSATMPALIGGGPKAKPGEVSMAHGGVLFLDELPEFSRQALDALRQPIETGEAVIARASHRVTYPARFQLIAAMNPCRCGNLGDPDKACSRAPLCAEQYQQKISGPILDRFDIIVELSNVALQDQLRPVDDVIETSDILQKRIEAAQKIQLTRMKKISTEDNQSGDNNPYLNQYQNAHIKPNILEETLNQDAKSLLIEACDHHGFSMRGYHRILRVSRTIADLASSDIIDVAHIAEAISYRRKSLTKIAV